MIGGFQSVVGLSVLHDSFRLRCFLRFSCNLFAFSRRLAIVFAAAAAVQRVIVLLLYAMRVVRSFMAVIARFFSRFDYFTVCVFLHGFSIVRCI